MESIEFTIMSGRKREYKSGSKKRREKQRKIDTSIENTNPLESYYGTQGESSRGSSHHDIDNERAIENVCAEPTIEMDSIDTNVVDNTTNELGDDIICEENEDCVREGNSDSINIDSETVMKTDSKTECNESKCSSKIELDLTNEYPTDRGILPADIKDTALKRVIIEHGSCKPRCEYNFVNSDGKQNFLPSYYSYREDNIEVPRQRLCYSPSLQKPYCEVCWLFAERGPNLCRSWIDGVEGTTKHMSSKIYKHEKTDNHIQAAHSYGRWKAGKVIDKDSDKQMKLNVSFWTKVLQRLIAIILTLSSLNMALRGHRETVGEGVCEGGNFLGLVALVAQYDNILAEVISLPHRATKYLSHGIQEELVELLGNAVRSSLVRRINCAPFWSIILDTTSDITRIDQLSVIVRWVDITEDNFELVESFLGFVEVSNADAHSLVETTKKFVKNLGIDFSRLRGQGYDGASVMSGVRGGVQKLIKEMCQSPVPFVHCASHNLNLVINDMVACIPQNTKFFTIMQEIFNFFGKSLNRWRELAMEEEKGSLTLKKLCTTRWTSRINAVRALRDRYVHILKVLAQLSLTSDNPNEKCIASGLRKKMESFEFVVFIVFWERILRSFDKASQELQSKSIDLSKASRLLNCTSNELQHLRNNFESVLETATAIAVSWKIKPVFTPPRSRKYFFSDHQFIGDIVEPSDSFRYNIFYQTIDRAKMELTDFGNLIIYVFISMQFKDS